MPYEPSRATGTTARNLRSLTWPLILSTAAALAGCGAAPVPVPGTIHLTDASGNVQPAQTSLQRGASIYLDVEVGNDPRQLGVNWVATCTSSLPTGTLTPGSQDPTCGAFTYAHTMSGPVPGYYSSLPVGTPPIVTRFTAPATVPPGGSVTIVAHATADPAMTSSFTLTII